MIKKGQSDHQNNHQCQQINDQTSHAEWERERESGHNKKSGHLSDEQNQVITDPSILHYNGHRHIMIIIKSTNSFTNVLVGLNMKEIMTTTTTTKNATRNTWPAQLKRFFLAFASSTTDVIFMLLFLFLVLSTIDLFFICMFRFLWKTIKTRDFCSQVLSPSALFRIFRKNNAYWIEESFTNA